MRVSCFDDHTVGKPLVSGTHNLAVKEGVQAAVARRAFRGAMWRSAATIVVVHEVTTTNCALATAAILTKKI